MTIQVLIVDDSAVVRTALTEVLESAPGIEVMGAVRDPVFALRRLEYSKPDVIILDVEMPRMDGITFLKKLMAENPIPVIMCSTLTSETSAKGVEALSLGAVEVINKPKVNPASLTQSSAKIISAVRNAAGAQSSPGVQKAVAAPTGDAPLMSFDELKRKVTVQIEKGNRIVAIGASTGGTQALEVVVRGLTVHSPGVVVVQHMPESFTTPFASRLNTLNDVTVKEACQGELINEGTVYIAPGGFHTTVRMNNLSQFYLSVKPGPAVSRHCPSVDVLFRSVATCAGDSALGVIMTGMGDDGAKGLKEMLNAGAKTVAQSEETCVVFGMPGVAVDHGAVQRTLALHKLAGCINDFATAKL